MSQLIACPECKKHLQVPDELMGKKVQCPECKHTFTATAPGEGDHSKTGTTSSAPPPPPPSSPAWEKDDDRSSSKGRKRSDDGYDIEKRRDDDDDDDEDDDDRPRRRKRRRSSYPVSRGNYVPHRGGMILAFGIISIVTSIFIFGIIAWIMGNNDMEEIRAGRMDPEGEGMTQAGRIIGMISTILGIIGILACCAYFMFIFFVFGMIGAAAANNPRRVNPPRRF
ncbi:MAG: hypothetical protein HYX68_19545 [Planctomycetes bacterium]|nr:hypothetical protein [Planctomycetota bacterium]